MHQLSLFVIIVVISGALCEDAVVLMAECPRTKLLNMDSKGKVYLSQEGPPTPNITLGGRIVVIDGQILALTTLYFKRRHRYLCIDLKGKLHGESQLSDRCYFLENDVRGKYEYRLWQDEKLVVQFQRKGRNPPCSEFHKIDSAKYHAVPSTIRVAARTSFPNDINHNKTSSNSPHHHQHHHHQQQQQEQHHHPHQTPQHKPNNSLSTIGGGNTNSGENRHRHRHGSQRKQVERRRQHQLHQQQQHRNKESAVNGANDSSALAVTGPQGGGKHLSHDRSKLASVARRKHRTKKQRLNRPSQLGLSGPSGTGGGSQELGRRAEKSDEVANAGESIANKDDSLMNSPRHKNGKRRSYSNVHDEYSNDEPSAINDRPIQNSLTDFLTPSAKKYHIRNWITSSSVGNTGSSSSGSLSRTSDANADSIPKLTSTNSKDEKDDGAEPASSSINSSSNRSNPNSSIASSQPPHSHMKKYYQNKTAHYKSPAVLKPDKMRRLRSRPGRNNDNSE